MTGCSASEQEEHVETVRIAHNSNAGALTARFAQEEGIFEEHGIEADFTQVENIESLPPALGQSFDVVLSAPTLLIGATAQGIPLTQVAGASVENEDNPSAVLLAGADSGISDITDLEGQRLGVLNETGTLHVATKFWLLNSGVDPSDVDVVQVDGPAQADQLASGRIDAVETIMPFMHDVTDSGEAVEVGHPHLEMASEIGLILWAARQDWAADNAEVVQSFSAALAAAGQQVEDEEELARSHLQEYTGLDDEAAAAVPLPTYDEQNRPQDLDLWLQAMREVDGFEGEVETSDLVFEQDHQ